VAKKHIFKRAMNPSNHRILIPADIQVNHDGPNTDITTTPQGQHLACFVGGMVALGGRIFNRQSDIDVAIQLTDGCIWTYNATASGIGPELYHFVACGGVDDKQTGVNCTWDEQKWQDAVRKYWWPADGLGSSVDNEKIEDVIRTRNLPLGMVDVSDRRYILRPEAIESVFVLYRVTGDPRWMDAAWNMFLHVEAHTRTEVAAAALEDVTTPYPKQVDSMESFWLAETLKYFYLVFSDWELVNLDKWVLNTEAHPLKRPVIEI
jgi:hypothetical protein